MREASIYKRPNVLFTSWRAFRNAENLCVLGCYKTHPPSMHVVLYFDSEQQVAVGADGEVVLLSHEASSPAADAADCTQELVALMRTPRHTRDTANFAHPDDCPELRGLLSNKGRK